MAKVVDLRIDFEGRSDEPCARKIRANMEQYFGQFPEEDFGRFKKVRFRVLERAQGGKHQERVEFSPTFAPTITTTGIRITVWIEGTLGATGFLYCDQRQREMQKLIEEGPPQKDRMILVKEQEIRQREKELAVLTQNHDAAKAALKRAAERLATLEAKVSEKKKEKQGLEDAVRNLKNAKLLNYSPETADANG